MNRALRRLIASATAAVCAAAGFSCGSAPEEPRTAPAATPSGKTRVAGEYLVTLVAPAEIKAIAELYGQFGIKSIKQLGRNVFLVTLNEDPGPAAMEKLRVGNAHIKAVEPNLLYRAQENGGAR